MFFFFSSLTCSPTHSHSLFIAVFVTFQFKSHFLQEASPGHTAYNSLLGGSAGKESAYNSGDLDSISGLGRSSGGGHGNPLQYSCLENPHRQRSLAGCSPWDHIELDTTERLSTEQSISDVKKRPDYIHFFLKSFNILPKAS